MFLTKTPPPGRFHFLAAIAFAAALLALGLSWLAPNHYPPWTSFHGEAFAFAALIFSCAARLLACPVRHWKVPALFGLGAAAILSLQWYAGQIAYGGEAVLSAMYIVGACWSWWLGRSSTPNTPFAKDELDWLSFVILLGAVTTVFVGILQWLRLETSLGVFAVDRGPDMRAYGNLGQPNHMATLCSMAAIVAIGQFRSGRLKARHCLLLLAWFALGVTASESRSGLLGAVLAGCLLLLLARGFDRRRQIMGAAAAWLALVSVGTLCWPAINSLLYLSAARATQQMANDSGRLTMWKQSLAAIQASPWYGHGWHQTMLAQKLAAVTVSGWQATDYAHNLVLDLAIWVGIPLAVVLVVAGLGWFLARMANVTKDRELFVLIATVPFAVHSLFEFPYAYAYFLFPVCWLYGRAQAESAGPSARPGLKRHNYVGAIVLIGYTVMGLVIFQDYMAVEEDYRVMRFELRRVGRTPAGYESPKIEVLTQLDAILKAGRLAPVRNMPAADLEMMRKASERNGWATLDLGYAVALALNGDVSEASRRLRLIRKVYGEESGRQAVMLFREFADKYPELRQIQLD